MAMNRQLLVVEDNPDDEALTLRALNKSGNGIDVTVARDGAEALSMLLPADGADAGRLQPRLILLDLKLPRLDGLELLQRLRLEPRTRNLTIVVFTSSDELSDVETCQALGANSYVRKPLDYQEYSDTVRRICEYWLSLNLAP